MGIVLDLVLVAILIVAVILAAKRGVLTAAVEVVAFALAVFIASSIAQPVAEGMYKAFFSKTVQKGIYEVMPTNPATLNYSQKAQIVMDNIPQFAQNYATKVGINLSTLSSQISKSGFKSDAELYKNLEDVIVRPIAVAVLKNIMFFVLAVALAIVLKVIVNALCKGLKNFELIGAADKIIGGILGVIKGAVVVFLLCCLLTYLKPRFENPKMIEAVNDSSIVALAEGFNPMEAISAAGIFTEK